MTVLIFSSDRARRRGTRRRCGYGLNCSGICIIWGGLCTDMRAKCFSLASWCSPRFASDLNRPPSRPTSRNSGSKVSRRRFVSLLIYFSFGLRRRSRRMRASAASLDYDPSLATSRKMASASGRWLSAEEGDTFCRRRNNENRTRSSAPAVPCHGFPRRRRQRDDAIATINGSTMTKHVGESLAPVCGD